MRTFKLVIPVEDQEILGGSWLVNGTLTIVYVRDRNADSDADGNRGRDVTYEDERVWELHSAAAEEEDGGCFYVPYVHPTVQRAAQEWADNYVVTEWDMREEDRE